MMGRPGSGRARKASISFPRSATTMRPFEFNNSHSGTRVFAWTSDVRLHIGESRCDSRFRVRANARPGMTEGSGAGDEERRQPGLDVIGDLLTRAILGIPVGAGAGKALQLSRDVIGHAGERGAGHDRFVRGDLDQIV